MKPGRIKPLQWGYLRNLPQFTENEFLFDGTRVITQDAEKPSDVTNIQATTVKGFLEQMFYPSPAPAFVPIQINTFEIVSSNNIVTNFIITLNKPVSISGVTGFLSFQVNTGHTPPPAYANVISLNSSNFTINGTSVSLNNPFGIMLSPAQTLVANFYISEGDYQDSKYDKLQYASGIGNGNVILGIEYTKSGSSITDIIAAYTFQSGNITSATLTTINSNSEETTTDITDHVDDYILESELNYTIPTNGYITFTLKIIDDQNNQYQESRTVRDVDTPIDAIIDISYNQIVNFIGDIGITYNKAPSSIRMYLMSSGQIESHTYDNDNNATFITIDYNQTITSSKKLIIISSNNGYSDVSYESLTYVDPGVTVNDYSIVYFYDTVYTKNLEDALIVLNNNQAHVDDYTAHVQDGYITLTNQPDSEKYVYVLHKRGILVSFDTIFIGGINNSNYSGKWGCPSNSPGVSNDMMFGALFNDDWILYRSKVTVKPTEKVFLLKDCTRLFILGANSTTSTGDPYYISNSNPEQMANINNLVLRNENENHVHYAYNLAKNQNYFWAISFYVAYKSTSDNFIPDSYSSDGSQGNFSNVFKSIGEVDMYGLKFYGFKNKINWESMNANHIYTDTTYET